MRLQAIPENGGRPAPASRAATAATGVVAPQRREPPTYDARDLTDDEGKATILLGDQVYTLRITRQGKLLLTK